MNILKQSFLYLCLSISFYGDTAVYPVVILGGGIGALTSALYLGRAELSPLVIEGKNPGGLLSQSHSVQNWPGEMEIDGSLLTEKMRKQADANGAKFVPEEVVSVDFSQRPFVITTRSVVGKKTHEYLADCCIIAMGTQPNYLKVPGETGAKGYWGKGVSNCAICDGNLYKDKIVGIVGGGDAAVLEALYLSKIAKEVVVFVRKDKLRATEKKRVQALLEKPNVRIMYETQVAEIKGNGSQVTEVVLSQGRKKTLFPLDGLFLAIGSTPNSRLFQGKLDLDASGYIVVQDGQQTSVEGVYAVGDIVDPVCKQAISASGDGAKAALAVQQVISDRNFVAQKENTVKGKIELPYVKEVIEIRSLEQFKKELETSDIPVLVDFYAPWCGPCKRISPALETSAAKLSGKVKFLKVNVDHLRDLTDRYEIRSMPTALLFDNQGNIMDRKVGLNPIVNLLDALEDVGN